MAFSGESSILAKRRVFSALQSKFPESRKQLKALFESLAERGIDSLQYVPFDNLTETDVVILAGTGKLYALFLKKETATAASFKATDHATLSSDTAQTILITQNSIREDLMVFPSGMPLALGLTVHSDTTADGGTTSAAGDGAEGFVILGAA